MNMFFDDGSKFLINKDIRNIGFYGKKEKKWLK